ncbi:hypothetical protein GUITHDRAFT_152509 [Guillardia theta CCMP2712]|uniref:Uncharacterized protein n=1 Tax=Guillardia theta (strain CCMP2712) TaxID=905079 RepID=L1JCI2_GUITC|nr:hypothetical protein GUITHDRAFT_152509 [Guillardia theta CCMP2712]EKX46032.1 hypothetical protein GUITHDRAFT_152509 [Guillardia theta CCMP2712]|eukprot:XP_005833012.1 hypothetical protein GUITHDRAFT_152509 [Guillardia theta CCMP2712]
MASDVLSACFKIPLQGVRQQQSASESCCFTCHASEPHRLEDLCWRSRTLFAYLSLWFPATTVLFPLSTSLDVVKTSAHSR